MAEKTILLKAHPQPALEEYKADAALSPGHLLELTTTGVKVHATAGGKCYALVALEAPSAAVATAYASGDRVSCVWLRAGDEFLGILYNGEAVVIGDYLESQGDGTLRKAVADTSAGTIKVGSLKFVAVEAKDMSGSAGVDPTPFFRVKVIS